MALVIRLDGSSGSSKFNKYARHIENSLCINIDFFERIIVAQSISRFINGSYYLLE